MSDELLEAMREVDALTPGSPPIYVEPPKPRRGQVVILPRGWTYNSFVDTYFGPGKKKRIEGLTVRNARDPQKLFLDEAADLADVLSMAARTPSRGTR